MSIFSKIKDKIFGHGRATGDVSNIPGLPQMKPAATSQPTGSAASGAPHMSPPPAAQAQAQPTAAAVDVEAVLTQMASGKGGGGNWQTSIVDLLKLLDLDSSLEARKELAQELNVNAGAAGSAEQNIALHKAVMRQLAANGGKVPASMRD